MRKNELSSTFDQTEKDVLTAITKLDAKLLTVNLDGELIDLITFYDKIKGMLK